MKPLYSLTIFLYGLLGSGLAAIVYLVFLPMPLFQDDLVFLYHARQACDHGILPWLLRPSGDKIFWRPISVGLHWLILGALPPGLTTPLAHLANCMMHALAGGGVAWASAMVLRHWRPDSAPSRGAAAFAGFLYAAHPVWLLPGAWPSAIQESYAIFFGALTIGFWLTALLKPARLTLFLYLASINYLAALASKEGAVLLPIIALLCASRPGYRQFIIPQFWWRWFLVFGPVTLVWFAVRAQIVSPVPEYSTYRMIAGVNVLRNAASLAAFAFGMPREALMGAMMYRNWTDVIPAGISVTLVFSMFAILVMALKPLPHIALGRAVLFVGLTISPYILLKGNCYPYYLAATLALLPLMVAAAWSRLKRKQVICLSAMGVGALLATVYVQFSAGEYKLLARAERSKMQLEALVGNPGVIQAASKHQPIYLKVDSIPDYAANGYLAGPALALDISTDQIHEVQNSGYDSGKGLLITINRQGYGAPKKEFSAPQP